VQRLKIHDNPNVYSPECAAAYCAAIEQIGKVYDLRGVFP
jgi:hypothetical protein